MEPASGMNQRQPILRARAGGVGAARKVTSAREEQHRKGLARLSWLAVAMGSGAGRTGSEETMENSPMPATSYASIHE